MAEKKAALSPVEEVLRGRRPSENERRWAETTLTQALERQPERPIGAARGTNLDGDGGARFTTISGRPVRRLYTQADLPEDWSEEKYLGLSGRGSLHARHSRHGIPRQAVDDAPVFGLRLAGGDQRALSCTCWSTAATDFRWPSTCRP